MTRSLVFSALPRGGHVMKTNQDAAVYELRGGLRRPGRLHLTTRVALSLLLALSHPLWAATIIVDETTCTLVDAITAANTDSPVGGCPAGSGADIIELTNDVLLTSVNVDDCGEACFWGETGLPEVVTEISIAGGGHAIQRQGGWNPPGFRLFLVSGSLTLSDVVLRGGGWVGYYATNEQGGGIANRGSLALTDSTVANNNNSGYSGGGIANRGTATLVRTVVSGNWAYYDGGGIFNEGGTLVLTDSVVSGNGVGSDNFGSRGGGIGSWGGNVTLTNSTISDNRATPGANCHWARGGGIYISGGALDVTNSTISGNGAWVSGSSYWGTPPSTGEGGGIFSASSATLTNSIIANNFVMDEDYWGVPWTVTGNCAESAIIDNGNNFADDPSCGPGFADITPGVDIDTTLADNGGPTPTHALLPGSVAIDAAGDCGLATDQRGMLRWDASCDSGSFEYGAIPADADQDGVLDTVDACLDTIIPESVPTNRLGVNRWALLDDDGVFDTAPPPGGGNGPDFEFTIAATRGCSCEQIIEAMELGWGHTKSGCSTGMMLQWIDRVVEHMDVGADSMP